MNADRGQGMQGDQGGRDPQGRRGRKGRSGTGVGTRVGIGLQVVFTGLLALGAVLLVNWLVGRPGIRQRFDLTEKGLNTLSTAARGVLERLEEPIQIDVFFRGEEPPLTAVASEVMQRTFRLLVLFDQETELLEVENHDMTDTLEVQRRLEGLKVRGFENCVVVSCGESREVVRLLGGLAQFDPGRPRQAGYRPASVLSFDAEKSIVQAILSVTSGEALKVYFSTGHGERDLYDLDDPRNLGKLQTELVQDGLEAGWWRFDEDGPVPDDASALAIIGPKIPFADEELEAVKAYAERGGRLIVAPPQSSEDLERSSLGELLEDYGLVLSSGVVCQPYQESTGNWVFGDVRNAAFRVRPDEMLSHDITDPLRQGGRSVFLSHAHEVKIERQPDRGGVYPLLRTQPITWLDQAPYDYEPRTGVEDEGPFDVGVVGFVTPAEAKDTKALAARPETRLVVVGSADTFCSEAVDYNGDFVRNVFNWACSREYRVNISPGNPDRRILALGDSDQAVGITRFALWGLPGICLVLGTLTAFLRRSRGPRRSS